MNEADSEQPPCREELKNSGQPYPKTGCSVASIDGALSKCEKENVAHKTIINILDWLIG